MLPSSLSCSLALSLVLVACGGSTADPPGSGTLPGTAATTTAPTSPPSNPPSNPGTPTATPTSAPTTAPTATPTSMPTVTPPQPNACNALVNVAPSVGAMQVAAEPPSATGGAVTNGTYHLVDLTIYTGAAGQAGAIPLSIKQTIAIHGASADAITDVGGKPKAQSTTFVTSGTTVTTAGTCPTADAPETGEYSATPASLVLYLVNGQGNTVGYTYVP